nr:high affinity cationic amino acid transporter 1-like [Onthophagus taurus]
MVLASIFTRRKNYAAAASERTVLERVLSTLDLTALGVGSTVGFGVYVIAGQVAKEIAGPAVVVSFLIAAVASILSGLCYAEFGARIPKAGSAYIYSYVTVGELVAFIVGWNLILEYVIGAASIARGISLYIDMLAGDVLKDTFVEIAPIHFSIMGKYFDFLAFGLAILISVALAFGLKESTKLNNVITALNLVVILFIIIAGAIHSDNENWNRPKNITASSIENGGFLPFGITEMLKGAATCFYAFVGFDYIAAAGEEVKNPKRALPFAIIGSQIIIFLAYFSTSTVLTMMVPFYELCKNAPIPDAFKQVDFEEAKWIVAIGGICGLFTSLFGSMLPLPRILYALASDGLIFKFLGSVNSTFSTPLVGTLIAGLITGIMAGLFDLPQLVHMMSIGTLLAYTLVSACVLILRYRDAYGYDDDSNGDKLKKENDSFIGNVFNTSRNKEPTRLSQNISLSYILIYTTLALVIALLLFFGYSHLEEGRLYIIILVSVVGGIMIILLFLLAFQPTTKETLFFKVPFVPIIPALSVLINIYLMLMLDYKTWIRFGVWTIIGILIYLLCIRKSCLTPTKHQTSYSNGHTSLAYVVNEDSASEEKPPSEDSGIARSMENIPVIDLDEEIKEPKKQENILVMSRKSSASVDEDVKDALAMLDKVVQDDDGLRRLSYGNYSTASFGELITKDVDVIVHREDVKSIPTTPVIEIPSAPYEEENLQEEISENESFRDKNLQDEDHHDDGKLTINVNFDSELKILDSPQLSINFSDGETDTDSLEVIIPPPPPLEIFEKSITHIPRISIPHKPRTPTPDISPTQSPSYNIPPPPPLDGFSNYTPYAIPKVKTSTPPTPIKDYPTQPSKRSSVEKPSKDTEESDDETINDNVRFGDKQHLQLKDKLEKLFMVKAATQVNQPKLTKPIDYPVDEEVSGLKTLKPVMSQIISEITKSNAGQEDELNDEKREKEKLVDETPQTPGDIKNRLTELFRSTRENPTSPRKIRKPLEAMSNETQEINNAKDIENHKMNMANALSTIKLRNVQKD